MNTQNPTYSMSLPSALANGRESVCLWKNLNIISSLVNIPGVIVQRLVVVVPVILLNLLSVGVVVRVSE